jgi:hypothetical protein
VNERTLLILFCLSAAVTLHFVVLCTVSMIALNNQPNYWTMVPIKVVGMLVSGAVSTWLLFRLDKRRGR